MNWLKTRYSPSAGGVEQSELHTGQGVSDVEHAPGLAPLAVHREGVAHHGLDAEAVEHGPEHGVVVEARGQVGVHGGLVGLLAVDHALVEVRGPQAPDATGEVHVVAVVHLGQVVEGPGLLGIGQHVGAALVGDLDEALFDVDVGGAVLPHGPELHEVDRRVTLGDGVEQVERAHHVVDLGVDGMGPVDHGVGRAALLGEVDDGLGLEALEQGLAEAVVGEIAHEGLDAQPRHLGPAPHPVLEMGDGDEAVHPHLEVVLAPAEVVDHAHVMAPPRQMQRRRPPQVPVAPQHEDPQAPPPPFSSCACASGTPRIPDEPGRRLG